MRHTVLGKRVDSGQCGSSLGAISMPATLLLDSAVVRAAQIRRRCRLWSALRLGLVALVSGGARNLALMSPTWRAPAHVEPSEAVGRHWHAGRAICRAYCELR
jgi:hypothetical protein